MSRALRIVFTSLATVFLITVIGLAVLAIWSVDPDLSERLAKTAAIFVMLTVVAVLAATFPGQL